MFNVWVSQYSFPYNVNYDMSVGFLVHIFSSSTFNSITVLYSVFVKIFEFLGNSSGQAIS